MAEALRAADVEASRGSELTTADLDHVCFYITPIGEEGTEQRKHADLILGQIVEPAIESLGLGLTVVPADRLTQPGMISQQILQNVLGARLVVADLSYRLLQGLPCLLREFGAPRLLARSAAATRPSDA